MTGTNVSAWERLIEGLRPIEAQALAVSPAQRSEQTQAELQLMLATSLAMEIANHAHADPDYPAFLPALNAVFFLAGPVPDYIYWSAEIRGGGAYRISGYRGTTRFVEINIRAGDEGDGGGGGRTVGLIDLDDLTLDGAGYFSLVMSDHRPAGYTGDWVRLDALASNLLVRSAAYDWKNELDPRLAIERLDVPASRPRPSVEHIRERLASLPAQTRHNVVARFEKPMADLRRQGQINRFGLGDYSKMGGAVGQTYQEGLYDIDEGEGLLVETELPETCRYWSLMALSDQYVTVDWVNRQSSLNGLQARLDADGKFRAVLSIPDPGIANWIDTGGFGQGVYKLRWNKCSSVPTPVCRKVKLDDLRLLLPADTPVVTPEERDLQVRLRREAYQLRRRW